MNKIKNTIQVSKLSNLFLLICFISAYGQEKTILPYLSVLAYLIFSGAKLVILALKKKQIYFQINLKTKKYGTVDMISSNLLLLIWIPIICTWMYGVAIGLARNNPPSTIFQNFFGILLYFLIPTLLINKPHAQDIISITILSGWIQLSYSLMSAVSNLDTILNPNFFLIQNSLSENRVYYSAGLIIAFPIVSLALGYILFNKKKISIPKGYLFKPIKSILSLLVILIILIIPSMSKGVILSVSTIMLVLIFCTFIYSAQTKKLKKSTIFFLLLLISLCICGYYQFGDTVSMTFSKQESSNLVRSEQYHYLVEDISFWGKGLGAGLASGYKRDDLGYGFELTYVNLVHKFGIFSIFIFLSYFLTIFIAVHRIIHKQYIFESTYVIGAMGYLIMGAGNPILLSPICVTMHSLAIYILVYPYISKNLRLK